MRESPRVSVVIPAFQGEDRIGRTISRLEQQTFRNFEIIVVNDGSTDGTSAIVERLIDNGSRITLIEQANRGMAAARNLGVAHARGEFLAFLDDDDLWLPSKLELQIARIDESPGVAVVSCFSALVDERARLLGWRFGSAKEGNLYREMLEWDMISGGSVAMVRRSAFERVGGFDESLLDRADWDLWIRLARLYHFGSVPQTLVGYTRRAGSVSRGYERMLEDGRSVLNRARREDSSITDADYRAYVARDLFAAACFALVDDNTSLAWSYARRALQRQPGVILGRPRRLGVMLMLTLASLLPNRGYRRGAVPAMGRVAFGIEAGAAFDSLRSS